MDCGLPHDLVNNVSITNLFVQFKLTTLRSLISDNFYQILFHQHFVAITNFPLPIHYFECGKHNKDF